MAEGVRSRFGGKLVYATNRLTDASVIWWDAVDLIGIDAYYPLAKPGKTSSLPDLKAFWNRKAIEMEGLSKQWKKPIILTEEGYRSQEGALEHPWDFEAGKHPRGLEKGETQGGLRDRTIGKSDPLPA